MNKELFVFPGNACILKDVENNAYVGIAYCFMAMGCPVFATFSARARVDAPLTVCLLWIIESLEQGMRAKNQGPTTPIAYRDDCVALITGDGKHYGVGVSKGKFHYSCPEQGCVSDSDLSKALLEKMRCPDRN